LTGRPSHFISSIETEEKFAMPPITDPMLHLCRSAVQSTTELTTLYLGSMERMQSPQAGAAISEARDESSRILKQIQSASSLQELYQLQTRLARANTEKIVGYWTSVYSTAHLNQMEFLRQVHLKGLEWMDNVGHSLDGARTPEPMINAMRMVATAARSGYSSILRATEETVEQAVAEAERSSAGPTNETTKGASGSGGGHKGSGQAAA
jgi:hypothetical protein